ncbi:SCO6880 family protein [Kitasatospora sp. NPDC057541]|uniref:SCO6880 family protein n=1 Tax=unclassified Kitasatospora TaxID=2633591 RepID=UPI00367DB6A6
MSAQNTPTRRMFEFGPRETDGIVLGLSMGSIVVLGAAAFLMVRMLAYGVAGILIGLVVLLVTVAAVWFPIADRTAAQWAPIAITFFIRTALGWTKYRGGPAVELTPAAPREEGVEPMYLPGELAGTEVLTVPTAVGAIGVVKDTKRRTYVAIIRTRGVAFKLLTLAEQDGRLAMWADTLNAIAYAGDGIVRLQLLDITVPDSGDSLTREWATKGLRGNESTAGAYELLLDEARPVTQTHENYLVVMLDPRKARRQVRNLGGGDDGACAYLLQRCAQIEDQLSAAGISVEGALPPRAIGQVIRTAYEPGARWKLDARGPVTDDSGGAAPSEAGPMAAEAHWGHYRTDDTFHAVYWISEWPRKGVPGTFLEDLILRTNCERTLSITLQPLSPRHAADEVARAETGKAANLDVKKRSGFRMSARDVREADAIAAQDQALAEGHTLYRFLGLLRISAPSEELLDQACGEVETRAHALVLRRLYGEQDVAFPATLPLARGLRHGLVADVG